MVVAALCARVFLGTVFLMSALTKLAAPREFVHVVERYRILPPSMVAFVAWTLSLAELAIALMLFGGYSAKPAAIAATVMLAMFMVVVGVAMIRRQDLQCGCFGLLYQERVGWGTQVRDGLLVALSLIVLLWNDETLALKELATSPTGPTHVLGLLLTIGGFSFGVIVAALSAKREKEKRDQMRDLSHSAS